MKKQIIPRGYKDLTEEEQKFLRERYSEYMKDEYEEDFIGNQDGRSQSEWAHDKAWDDVLNMEEVKESIAEVLADAS